ncbi:uncharacterized protein LOC142988804 [Genypterus blacodes]|uniref:uncharacterized protein LOC142988804 n=1 Tax=Genypterus blacodes TaxID=154954 RepID=UPI003F761565
MASLRLLILLLASCCLPVFSVNDNNPTSEEQEKQKKAADTCKAFGQACGRCLSTGLTSVPFAGGALSGGINAIQEAYPVKDKVDGVSSDVQLANVKLDTLKIGTRWETWAAGAYQKPVSNIEISWLKYIELERGLKTSSTEKESLKNKFFTYYSQCEDSTLLLHRFLTAKPTSITENLGDLLANKLGCDEKEITEHFLYLNQLMFKGNYLNEMYDKLKGANTDARVVSGRNIASQSALALAKSHQRCVSHNAAHIERDIIELIDDDNVRSEIEKKVLAFLTEKYNRYDWLVAAFTTFFSKQRPKSLKKHVVRGFIKVERGIVTVAVAKQPKGTHTMAAAVKKAIESCSLREKSFCSDVEPKLMECQESVHGKRLSETYTAVHTFVKKNRQGATNAKEAPKEEPDNVEPPQTPNVYVGKCGKVEGIGRRYFIVLIKSDEEIMGVNPCTKTNCGSGKCVEPTKFIAMCECKYPQYGERCEKTLETYGTELKREVGSSQELPPNPDVSRSNNQNKQPQPSTSRSNHPQPRETNLNNPNPHGTLKIADNRRKHGRRFSSQRDWFDLRAE